MLKFENPTNGRFYYIQINKDMLDDSVLCITFGGANVVRHRVHMRGDESLLHREVEKLSKKRIRRGYILLNQC